VHQGHSSPKILDSYNEERLPIIAEMLNKTTELHNLNKVEKLADRDFKRGTEFNQLGVNYRGSSIIYEDETNEPAIKWPGYNKDSETAARAGDRAPEATKLSPADAQDESTSLFSIFSPSKHTVLCFSGSEDDRKSLFGFVKTLPKGIVQSAVVLKPNAPFPSDNVCDLVLVDHEGHAHNGYNVADDTFSVFVIRPDGVIGARIRSVQGVEEYFKRLFA